MSRSYTVPTLLIMILATFFLGAAVTLAARSSDIVLIAGTLCGVGGLALLFTPRPMRVPTASVVRRRRVRVHKAYAVERVIHVAAVGEGPSPQRQTHNAA